MKGADIIWSRTMRMLWWTTAAGAVPPPLHYILSTHSIPSLALQFMQPASDVTREAWKSLSTGSPHAQRVLTKV